MQFTGSMPAGPGQAIVHGGYNPHGNVHVYVLDVTGTTVVVVVNEYSSAEPFMEAGEEVVQTFNFDVLRRHRHMRRALSRTLAGRRATL